jgi:hypothetical protein
VHKLTLLRFIYECFIALNIGFSAAYALFTYMSSTRGAPLGAQLVSALDDMFYVDKNRILGLELAFILPMLAVALCLLLLLLLLHFAPGTFRELILNPIACVAALAAAPACWIYGIVHAQPGLLWFNGYPSWPSESGFSFLILEVSVAACPCG